MFGRDQSTIGTEPVRSESFLAARRRTALPVRSRIGATRGSRRPRGSAPPSPRRHASCRGARRSARVRSRCRAGARLPRPAAVAAAPPPRIPPVDPNGPPPRHSVAGAACSQSPGRRSTSGERIYFGASAMQSFFASAAACIVCFRAVPLGPLSACAAAARWFRARRQLRRRRHHWHPAGDSYGATEAWVQFPALGPTPSAASRVAELTFALPVSDSAHAQTQIFMKFFRQPGFQPMHILA